MMAPPPRLGSRFIMLVAMLTVAAGPALARAQSPTEPCVGTPSDTKLIVHIEGVRDARGDMTATLYSDDPAKFLKNGGELRVWRSPSRPPGQDMCIWLAAPGSYAVAIYQDSDGNHHFGHGMFGPTEAYGFSRNPHLFFGPPNVGQVKFAVTRSETTVSVRLHYP